MRLSDFEYELPPQLIAKYPKEKRDESRLMVLDKQSRELTDTYFKNIIDYLSPGDTLIANNTKVFPARLFGKKDKTGAKIEVFLLRKLNGHMWEVLVKPSRKVRVGNKIYFDDELHCDVIDNTSSGSRTVEFNCNGNLMNKIYELGNCPLPPYINREAEREDIERYQTVYAEKEGAVAAPTAGFHFTEELIVRLKDKGINMGFITLHVGLGTFRPVHVEDVSRHQMDSEYYEISSETAALINETKAKGHKVFAVGTTSVRTLETVARHSGEVISESGWTNKFIYPPYTFKVVDGLITNFHLPKSTLLMLVSAFADRDFIMQAYEKAVELQYRFYSYGDAMLII